MSLWSKTYYRRILNPFKSSLPAYTNQFQVYFAIEIRKFCGNKHPDVSVHGVHGPLKNGNCMGSVGQNIDEYLNLPEDKITYNKGWNKEKYKELIKFWKENHLHSVDIDTPYYHEIIKTAKTFPESTREPAWI